MEQNNKAAPAVDAANLQALPVDAVELDKLKALAEAATPGPWTWEIAGEESLNMAVLRGANNVRVCDFGVGDNHDPAEGTEPDATDMAFMAAANPAAILRIAALVAQQAARIEAMRAAGAKMANTMFNLAQAEAPTPRAASYKAMQVEWDAAVRATQEGK